MQARTCPPKMSVCWANPVVLHEHSTADRGAADRGKAGRVGGGGVPLGGCIELPWSEIAMLVCWAVMCGFHGMVEGTWRALQSQLQGTRQQ